MTQETIQKIRGLILFTAFIIVCLWEYNTLFAAMKFIFRVLFPFILGGVIAFILNVPMCFIERKLFDKETGYFKRMCKVARPISLFLVLLILLGIIAFVVLGIIPQLFNACANLGERVKEIIPWINTYMQKLFQRKSLWSEIIGKFEPDWDAVKGSLMGFFGNNTESMLDSMIGSLKSVVSGLTSFLIAVVFAIYFLLQKEKLELQAKKILFAFVRKGRAEAMLEVLALTYHTFSGFLTGQCVEAIILGALFVISMLILRLPYAILIGTVIAFTALVPIFGAFVGCAMGALLIFLVDPMKAAVFIILFFVLQQIEGNLIYPHVVGNSVGLPPIWVLAAVSIGGKLMGIVGMLIFIPIVSVMYALFREIIYLKLRKNGIGREEIK